MNAFLLPAFTLWRREIVRFLRQPSRVFGAIGSPALFWLLIGSGVGRSFAAGGDESYLSYVFPGTLLMVLLFTAIFSTISIIEDRREGFLQSVLVAPVPRTAVVLGKIAGGGSLALFQALLFLALAPTVGLRPDWAGTAGAVGMLAVLALALTGLGFLIAWRMDSTQGFHAVMNFLLLPMWILSGALFPVEGAAGWLRAVMLANPLTYGLAVIRALLQPESAWSLPVPPGAGWGISIGFALAAFLAAGWAARGHTRGDLQ